MRARARAGAGAPRVRLYPRHRLDLTFGDLAYAFAACAFARDAERAEERLAAEGGDAVPCVSLRSGFELLLDALALPRGSEVLVSAVTHPDMARILERHGLTPVPVDLDLETLAPRLDLVAEALTPQTRALLVAHLFGARVDLEPLAELARGAGLLLLEDSAQAFTGELGPDQRADVSLYSFGSIKTCTALGGGLVFVRDAALRARMREIRRTWPRQRRRDYLGRVVCFFGLHLLEQPFAYGLVVRGGARLGYDVDAVVTGSVRGLRPPPPGDAGAVFARWLRRRPSAPLLALLRRRLRRFDRERLRARAAAGEELRRALPPSVFHPGRAARARTHWVFPVAVPEPERAVEALRAAGFDATPATTSIAAVEPGKGARRAEDAAELVRTVVFVPAYPELPPPARKRLASALGRLA